MTIETETQKTKTLGTSAGDIVNESMTSSDRPRSYLLNPKHTINIAAWNVRTMYESSKAAQIAKEMRKYDIKILGISEARWTGNGKVRCSTGETIIYSGKENEHQSGVAIMINKETAKSLIEWYPVDDRLMYARFDSKHIKLSIIQCYSPTNEVSDEEKDTFYNNLQGIIHRTPKHDMIIVMGDMNAKVGNNNTDRETSIGKHGLGEMNENGERMMDFCEMNGLIACNTLFPHKDIHKYTWISPDKRTKNQIDYIMINRRWRRSVIDARTYRGADVNSDHVLLRAKIKLKLRATKKTNTRRKFAVHKLKQPEVINEFTLKLRNRFSALETEDQTIPEKWNNITTAFISAAEETIGYRKNAKEEWLTDGTWKLIEDRRTIRGKIHDSIDENRKEQLSKSYREKDKDVKKSVRKDKRTRMEKNATKAEEAARKGDMRELYKITKLMAGKFINNNTENIKDKDGQLLSKENDILKRWAEHFKSVLNRGDPDSPPNINLENNDVPELDIDIEVISKGEIEKAIRCLKNNKAAGVDNIPAELLKADLETSVNEIHSLFLNIWQTNCIPEDWKKRTHSKTAQKRRSCRM